MKRLLSIKIISVLLLSLSAVSASHAGVVRGNVTDSLTGEAMVGVVVSADGTPHGTATDMEGNYRLTLPDGRYDVVARYAGYKDTVISLTVSGEHSGICFRLTPDDNMLTEVTVTAMVRHDSESSQLREQKQSRVVQNGVSAQQISRTQDKDASEVIRRVPGISVIDDKFVMVRGLSQRYNSVWLNGSAVPSSEADSRAFSFDMIPGTQLDNIVIVKSPAPEYPADFTGGFVLVNTKRRPADNALNISLGAGLNTGTHFHGFLYAKGSATDPLGFDNGFRMPDAGMTGQLNTYPGTDSKINPLDNGLNNDWTVRRKHPFADMKLNMDYSHLWMCGDGGSLGLTGAVNYSNSHKRLADMENSLYGPYDTANDKPVFLRKATDNRYVSDVRLGALLNLAFQPSSPIHRFEWNNIFNQTGKDRYSTRSGFNAQPDSIQSDEYYYSSRTIYNTQFTGRHNFNGHVIDWSAGYAYANRSMPDRRLIERTDRTEQRMSLYRISREFSKLDEHIASLGANYEKEITYGSFSPMLKSGIYGEYRTRRYRTRQFQYGWDPDNTLPQDWIYSDDIPGKILIDENYGPDKLYMYEEINYLNNYTGKQRLASAYIGVNIPWNALSLYGGVRYEFCRQTLGMNTRQFEQSIRNTDYDYSDFFPSLNITYRLNGKNQLRAAYGRSTNRPEFRELAPSVFYDFDLGSNVMGNYNLKAAYIDNIDFRYEWYPSAEEQVSVALFYKHFKNPIEWTYTVAGGTDLIYTYLNAEGANNYGVELDVKKNLGFIGLSDFSLTFNGALIKSNVTFAPGTNNIDRPMQGQSPYIINTGLFYNNQEHGWSAAILYNRIGKRIVGVGNRYGTASDGSDRNIPNSYEMPRDNIDISAGKRLGRWEIKVSVRDLLAERYLFQQFETITTGGVEKRISEVTQSYKPGTTFSITAKYSF